MPNLITFLPLWYMITSIYDSLVTSQPRPWLPFVVIVDSLFCYPLTLLVGVCVLVPLLVFGNPGDEVETMDGLELVLESSSDHLVLLHQRLSRKALGLDGDVVHESTCISSGVHEVPAEMSSTVILDASMLRAMVSLSCCSLTCFCVANLKSEGVTLFLKKFSICQYVVQ